MPTILLKGGLGNQLFQYSIAKHISLRTGYKIYLDLRDYDKKDRKEVDNRRYNLDEFNIDAVTVSKCIYKNVNYVRSKMSSEVLPVSKNILKNIFLTYKEENPRLFDPEVLNLPGNILLIGYFQSEKYFKEIKDIIRKDISMAKKETKKIENKYKNIKDRRSVAVHVRRGDYSRLGWSISKKYYRKAVKIMENIVGNIKLYFFSDNINWVKNNKNKIIGGTNVSNYYFVENESPCKDLMLMKMASHNIISNSTFGWWGAWLGEDEKSVVISPKRWVYSRVSKIDIIPNRWLCADC